MPRILREPIVQFLVGGVLVFAAYRVFVTRSDDRAIIVSAATIDALREEQKQLTGRAPTAAEERALIERWIDNEVMLREARARGLDRDDVIVRRRLVQKMQFLTEDAEPISEPREDQLRAFFAEHPERYTVPERISFVHVFAARSGREPDRSAELSEWREALSAGADPASVGEPFVRGREFRQRSRAEIAEVFGSAFSAAVFDLPVGEWSEPVESSLGSHLVRVGDRTPERRLGFEEARKRVHDDWLAEQRTAANARALRRLRQSYRVEVEGER